MAATDIGLVLLQLFVLYAVARGLGALAAWLKMPTVVGEILAGVLIGATVLRQSLHLDGELAFLEIMAELGVVFLIFTVGLESPFDEMMKVGTRSFIVAALGVVVPFAAGVGLMFAMGAPTIEALFLGAAMVATSVGITARVLGELGVIGRKEARIVLGAAVIDDVLGLLVLTVVQALGSTGAIDPLGLALLFAQAIGFVGILMYFGGRVLRRVLPDPRPDKHEWTSSKGNVFGFAVIVCLGLSALASFVGLAAIIGAFLAGMAFAATRSRHDLVERFEGVVGFLVPFFFAYIGLQVNLAAAWAVAGLALGVTVLALLTKVVGCGIGALPLGRKSAIAVGIGMMPRGEVGIIVALIGLSLHAIPDGLYAVVVAMSLATTLVTPPLLVWAFKRLPPNGNGPPAEAPVAH